VEPTCHLFRLLSLSFLVCSVRWSVPLLQSCLRSLPLRWSTTTPVGQWRRRDPTARLATAGGGVELGRSCWPRPVQLLWSLGGTARGNCRWCGARAAVRGDGELMVAGGVRSSGAQLLAAASTATSLGARATRLA
jgi:hypothetical protein